MPTLTYDFAEFEKLIGKRVASSCGIGNGIVRSVAVATSDVIMIAVTWNGRTIEWLSSEQFLSFCKVSG